MWFDPGLAREYRLVRMEGWHPTALAEHLENPPDPQKESRVMTSDLAGLLALWVHLVC